MATRKHIAVKVVPSNPIKVAHVDSITTILTQRGSRYGTFTGHAKVTQDFKRLLKKHLNDRDKVLADDQQEALEMIFHKIGRIVNGDENYDDSWVDVGGYSKLVADRLQGTVR